MPLTFRQPASTCVGLDIGKTAVRAVQWRREHDRFSLRAVSVRSLRLETDGDRESERPMAEIVRTCVRDGEFGRRNLPVAINSPDVEFHTLELPSAVLDAPREEVQQVLRAELQRLVDTSIADWECRHWRLPPTGGPGPSVMAANAKRESVLQSLALCDATGVSCRRIDAGATALTRFVGLLCHWPTDAVVGVLDIGHAEARLILCIDDTPVLIRRVGHGGAEWTRRVAESLQLSQKAAELHKREHGIAAVNTDDRSTSASRTNREVAAIILGSLRPELREVAAEIKRSYEYVLSCYRDHKAGDLVLTGGGALMLNLPELFSDQLGITVRRASDYLESETCRLRYSATQRQAIEVLATATGLSMEPRSL